MFLIRSPHPNVLQGWARWIELQTFVTHREEGGGKKGACAAQQPTVSPSRAGPRGAAAAPGSTRCRAPSAPRLRQARPCEPRAPGPHPLVPRGRRGEDEGVGGGGIAMATVTSFYPGSNWRKPRGQSRSLPANRTCPGRPTLRASASPRAPPPLPPSARSAFIGRRRGGRRDSLAPLGASLGGGSEGRGAAARPSAAG